MPKMWLHICRSLLVIASVLCCMGCCTNTFDNNGENEASLGDFSSPRDSYTRSVSQIPTPTAPYAVGDLVVNWSSRKTIPGANSYNEYKMEMDYKYELQLIEPDSTYRYVELQSNYVEVVNPTDNSCAQYIVTYIPDKSYLGRYYTLATTRGIDCDIVPEFYGVILYSLLSGEPVAAYECKYGYLLNEVFVFDTTLSSDEKNEQFFSIMAGKSIAISTKSGGSTYTITDEEQIVGGKIICRYDDGGLDIEIEEINITRVQDVSTVINDGGNGGGTQPIVYTMYPPGNPMGCLDTLSGGKPYIPQPPPTSSTFQVSLLNTKNFCGYSITGEKKCKKLCDSICLKHGLTSKGSSDQVYKLMYEREGQAPGSRELVHYGNNVAENYANAINCIDEHLEQRRVIIVGVNYRYTKISDDTNTFYNEGATDHFVVVYGRGYDSERGMIFYLYYEVATGHVDKGCSSQNRLYYDNQNYLLFDNVVAGRETVNRYDVTQVRPNNGNIEGTVNQNSN